MLPRGSATGRALQTSGMADGDGSDILGRASNQEQRRKTSAVAVGGAGMNDSRKFSILDEWAAGLDDCNDLFRS